MFRRVRDAVRRHPWVPRAAAAALGLIALVAALQAVPVERPLAWLTERVHALGPWGPAAFALAFIMLTSVLLPATPVVMAAGAVFGTVGGALTMMVAYTLAAIGAFGVGRLLGGSAVARWVTQYPRLHLIYVAMGREEGWKIVAAVRLSHAAPFGLQNYLFGLSPVRFWPFLLTTWVAMLPGTIFYAFVGHAGATALAAATEGGPVAPHESWVTKALFLVVAALALTYVTRFAKRVMRQELHDAAVAEMTAPAERSELVGSGR
jgi:uncharacterized membrane protein YdjX (TVP38/TMEM64 family)